MGIRQATSNLQSYGVLDLATSPINHTFSWTLKINSWILNEVSKTETKKKKKKFTALLKLTL